MRPVRPSESPTQGKSPWQARSSLHDSPCGARDPLAAQWDHYRRALSASAGPDGWDPGVLAAVAEGAAAWGARMARCAGWAERAGAHPVALGLWLGPGDTAMDGAELAAVVTGWLRRAAARLPGLSAQWAVERAGCLHVHVLAWCTDTARLAEAVAAGGPRAWGTVLPGPGYRAQGQGEYGAAARYGAYMLKELADPVQAGRHYRDNAGMGFRCWPTIRAAAGGSWAALRLPAPQLPAVPDGPGVSPVGGAQVPASAGTTRPTSRVPVPALSSYSFGSVPARRPVPVTPGPLARPPPGVSGPWPPCTCIPQATWIEHVTDGGDCPCGPATEPVPAADSSMGWLITHHSLDGREVREPDHQQ